MFKNSDFENESIKTFEIVRKLMADDHVLTDEHIQRTSKGAKSIEFGLGSSKVNWNDLNHENEWILSASVDVFLRLYRAPVLPSCLDKVVNKIYINSS